MTRLDDGDVEFVPGEFIGWMGRCSTNLTAERACDEVAERSYGYSCTTETCGVVERDGSEPGQFDSPRGIAIDGNDVLYVTDYDNPRVQRFSPEGFFAGEAVSECDGTCFVLGDFGRPQDVTVNLGAPHAVRFRRRAARRARFRCRRRSVCREARRRQR